MRVNSKVFTERGDMLGGIQIPNCPSQFKAIAENILMLATKPGYSVQDYNTVTELDKTLMVDYWIEFDGLAFPILGGEDFKLWFKKHATPPELIRRARQWLVERNYLILKPDVASHALEAGSKFSKSVGGRG